VSKRHAAFATHDRRAWMIEPDAGAPFDDLLVLVARARDRAAFQMLFNYFAPRIKGYMLRLGATDGMAEDLAQEAMLTIWRKASLFDPEKASAATWIFTIARNLRIDAVRRERRPDFFANDPSLVPGEDTPADRDIMRKDDDLRLCEALSQLPPEQVRIVRLSFFADKTHSAIASELGLPLGTVKSRLRLAMARLRAAWEGEP
jgi:RNA polymerase sigma factor (sigma-70 family)